MPFKTWWAINLRSKVLMPLKSSNYCTSQTVMYFCYIRKTWINANDFLFAGNKNITVQSVKHVVSSATYDVYKATTVDLCITNGSSSTTHNVSNVSSDVLNNPLFISLLIISIIICLIIVAYVPIRSIEKYWIQLNQGGEDSGAI